MKNIHVLPTEKPSYLYQIGNDLTLSVVNSIHQHNIGRHIYITSDEKIKEGDWFHIPNNFIGFEHISKEFDNSLASLNAKKIILTTDLELIKDGVQAIDDNFLEWFIKNPKSENVYVYKEYKQVNQNNPVTKGSTALAFSHYEVQSLDLSAPIGTNEKEIMTNLPDGNDFFKQETLEEAATNYTIDFATMSAFKLGAKWQQEQDKNKFSE
jgi:hypothetical protein